MGLRILNHDYGAYPFIAQASRALARRGHEVLHVFSASNQAPNAKLSRQEGDPAGFDVLPLELSRPFQKWSYWRRRVQEIEYGRLVGNAVRDWRPDVTLSADTPTEAQKVIQRACTDVGSRFVFWVQDVYSVAVHKILSRKLPIVGGLVGRYYMMLERSLLRRSDAVLLITEDFQPQFEAWGVERSKTHVLRNWAPLDETPRHPKANPWANEHGLHDRLCLLYSGTLGMKHNPELLLRLALHFRDDADVRVVVVSEGPGADWLRGQRAEHGLDDTLLLLPWQPYDRLPEVLAAADVLVAILQPDAGVFSVPSKVLTYLCAARPLLLAIPEENLAARIVREHQAGLLAPPDDADALVKQAATLAADPQLRARLAANGRRYAEEHFNIEVICNRLEEVIRAACS